MKPNARHTRRRNLTRRTFLRKFLLGGSLLGRDTPLGPSLSRLSRPNNERAIITFCDSWQISYTAVC